MTWLRPLIPLLATILVAASAEAQPVPGQTGADRTLQRDVINLIMIYEMAAAQSCKTSKVVDTKVLKTKRKPVLETSERWTVNRCGKLVPYSVTLQSDPAGGTNIGIRPE